MTIDIDTTPTPTDALMHQLSVIEDAIDMLQAARADITGSIDPDTATWPDVARYALLVDRIKAADLDGNY